MEVQFADKKMYRAMGDQRFCIKLYGVDMAKKLALRIAALRAAVSLEDFWPPKMGPERCHELIGDQKGIFSIDLKQPYRLLFVPAEAAQTERCDERTRWRGITAITVIRIEDTHG